MSYSNAFKNISKSTISETQNLVKNGFWKSISVEEKSKLCEILLEKVSEVYGVSIPKFQYNSSISKYRSTGGGTYTPHTKTITLYHKFSLVTFLHEFRHHIQHSKKVKLYRSDIEEDARAWSVSLFKSALPQSYENSVRKGILHFN